MLPVFFVFFLQFRLLRKCSNTGTGRSFRFLLKKQTKNKLFSLLKRCNLTYREQLAQRKRSQFKGNLDYDATATVTSNQTNLLKKNYYCHRDPTTNNNHDQVQQRKAIVFTQAWLNYVYKINE